MAALKRELDARPVILIAGGLGLLGAIGLAIGIAVEPTRAFAAYLWVWCTVTTISIGGLAFLAIGYATNAEWPAVLRRLTEGVASAIVPCAILMIPLLVGAAWVWPWATDPDSYLNLPFFAVRSAIFLAALALPAELLLRARRLDRAPTSTLDRERRIACASLPIIGLATTFAGFDWLMSLQPHWWSSGFGLYVITGALASGLAVVGVLAWSGVARRAMPIAPPHFHALGRLLHAFVILWAYIAYFQAMLIQIANKPSEAIFYVARSTDGWRFVTALLVVLGFALPFPLLVPRRLKRRAGYVAGVCAIVILAHLVDMYWLVVPRVASPVPSWVDACALVGIGGLVTAVCAWRMHGTSLLPVGDPYLAGGLSYETTT